MFCTDTTDGNDLFYRIGFVPDDNVSSLRIKEVLKNAAFVTVFIVECVGLHLSDSNVGKAPDFRICIQPPIAAVFFAGSRFHIQFNSGQVNLI